MLKLTFNIQEAAEFLGFKSTSRLSAKCKQGLIPAFKAGKRWMFLISELEIYAKECYTSIKSTNDRLFVCHSQKRKIVHTGRPGLQSVESEYKNLREKLLNKQHSDTKTTESNKSKTR